MTIPKHQITGLVLSGGRGTRMGGVDKGLQAFRGRTLVQHALERLAPQVGPLMVSANQHLAAYQALGVPVWPDTLADHPGPLAGILAGLERCNTPYLMTVPCDAPLFPQDLVSRLAHSLSTHDADLALAATRGADGAIQRHPVFGLMKTTVLAGLVEFLQRGERKVGLWATQQPCAVCEFDDTDAFANVNTLAELKELSDLGRATWAT